MKKLNINPGSIDEVFISHPHFDHIGGLSAFLNENNEVTVFVPVSVRGIRDAKEIIYVDEPKELHENIFSTGELDHLEQSMAVRTGRGLVLFVGCSHPDMHKIFGALLPIGKIHAIIGGLHGFSQFRLFQDLEMICPAHCTEHAAEMKATYPEKIREGGVGRIFTEKELNII
jgi:7,8-dihydropterin-6-yl-methyl-4-(beta-D-ribofuranosyl)aminobenzene 5'-phosphate synthase